MIVTVNPKVMSSSLKAVMTALEAADASNNNAAVTTLALGATDKFLANRRNFLFLVEYAVDGGGRRVRGAQSSLQREALKNRQMRSGVSSTLSSGMRGVGVCRCIVCVSRFPKERRYQLLRDPTYERILFVRNPYTRVFSAWVDKFQGTYEVCKSGVCDKGQFRPWLQMSVKILEHNGVSADSISRLREDPAALLKAVTWPRFLRSVLAKKAADRHWREQVEETKVCAFRPTFLGKQEFGSDDLQALLAKLNYSVVLPSVGDGGRGAGADVWTSAVCDGGCLTPASGWCCWH